MLYYYYYYPYTNTNKEKFGSFFSCALAYEVNDFPANRVLT